MPNYHRDPFRIQLFARRSLDSTYVPGEAAVRYRTIKNNV